MQFVLFRQGEKPSPLKKVLFIPILILLIPFAALASVFHILRQKQLAKLMLTEWSSRGKYFLLCYYPGSLWREYIEHEILPKWGKYMIVMNWSEQPQVEQPYARLAHQAFSKFAIDYDYLSPEADADMRAEYQAVLLALHANGKVEHFSTYPASPKEVMKYEAKFRAAFKKTIEDCLKSWGK